MLSFMRKYQKYFFIAITFVIVISFSFFGTSPTLQGNNFHEQIAFTTISGKDIVRSELEEMALFIGTDAEDKKLFGGIWGPNFLNDGVIRKDFLESGLAQILMESYAADLRAELTSRYAREGRFVPYVHPQAQFLSSQNTWAYFAPAIAANLEMLKNAKDPLSPDALFARVNLFLAERRFPSPYLVQILRYQEKQSGGIQHDPTLDHQDFSLFGYHTVDDWFGSRFIRLVSEFIFNAADIARDKGYRVTKEETLSDLIANAQTSFKDNQGTSRLGVVNSTEYFDQQLIRMRLDKTKVVNLWQNVLLFRRLFQDVGQSAFVDPLAYKSFNQFANEVATGELFRLPDALRFSDFRTLQKFETYLDAVSKRDKSGKNILLLPTTLLKAEEVAKRSPELVQKRYELEIATVSKKALESKVSVKETLNWELDEKNWKSLQVKFPELGLKKGNTLDERLSAIDSLDSLTRMRTDQYARQEIAASHPEWIQSALMSAELQPVQVNLSLGGGSSHFSGLKKGESLIKLLDKAEVGKDETSLQEVTFDQNHYYRIKVKSRSPDLEVMTFAEANKGSILDKLLDDALEIAYVQLRAQNPEEYQTGDKAWKSLAEVKDKVALAQYSKVLDAIKANLKGQKNPEKYQNLQGERLTPYRFLADGESRLQKLQKDKSAADTLTVSQEEAGLNSHDQFKWVKGPLQLKRKGENSLKDADKLFKQAPNTWSEVVAAPNGALYFAWLEEQKNDPAETALLHEQVSRASFLLGTDAERSYLRTLLPLLKEKKAISFDYLYTSSETMEPENGT